MLGPDPRPPSNDREDEALLSDEGSLIREDVSILADVVAVLKSSWLPALFVGLVSGMVATSFLMSDAESKCYDSRPCVYAGAVLMHACLPDVSLP